MNQKYYATSLVWLGLTACLISGSAEAQNAVQPSKTSKTKMASEASNRVGQTLLAQLNKAKSGKDNIVISPVSINMVLTMILNACDGATLDETAKFLGVKSNEVTRLNESTKDLLDELVLADPDVEVEIANATYVRKGLQVNRAYLVALKNYLNAKFNNLDFAGDNKGALTIINDWARVSTRGRIPTIFTAVDPSTVAMVLNATYFKATWKKPFEASETSSRSFALADGTKVDVQTMKRFDDFSYLQTSGFQAVALPYGNGRFCMYVFLPSTGTDLETAIAELDEQKLSKHLSAFRKAEGTLFMPKFKLDLSYELTDGLQASGLRLPFDGANADLSKLMNAPAAPQGTTPAAKGNVRANAVPALSQVATKVFIEVDEKGTEAAAVTGGTFTVTGFEEKPAPFVMDVNRPFLILIRDSQTGANLFVGAIAKP